MKKKISLLLTVFMLLSCILMTGVAGATNDFQPTEYSFFISFYNDTDRTYAVENTKITVEYNMTIFQTLDLLKEQELLVDYQLDGNDLKSITLTEQKIETTAAKNMVFYTKINGQKQSADTLDRLIANGDIVEWIYGTLPEEVYVPPETEVSSQVEPKPQTKAWTEQAQAAITSGCEFLTLHQETSNFYMIAMGGAGKTADVKMVNDLLSNIRKTKLYSSPSEIAKNILSLTFCGYDASELVETLASYPNIGKQGIMGAINGLLAYDSKLYSVPSDQLNTRETLIKTIVTSQRESGGFGVRRSSEADLDTTALAITALSPYYERSDIQKVIDKAVDFIIENQTQTGGFTAAGKESSESLSKVITALNAIGIENNDPRFVKNKVSLLDRLLRYKNEDGGFSQIQGGTSAAAPTEQAIMALCSIKINDTPYKMTRPISPLPTQKTEDGIAQAVKLHPLRTLGVVVLVLLLGLLITAIILMKKRAKKGLVKKNKS